MTEGGIVRVRQYTFNCQSVQLCDERLWSPKNEVHVLQYSCDVQSRVHIPPWAELFPGRVLAQFWHNYALHIFYACDFMEMVQGWQALKFSDAKEQIKPFLFIGIYNLSLQVAYTNKNDFFCVHWKLWHNNPWFFSKNSVLFANRGSPYKHLKYNLGFLLKIIILCK